MDNFERQKAEIERKKVLLEAMMQQQSAKPQIVSGHYIGPNAFTAIGDVLKQYIGGKQREKLDLEASDIDQKYNQSLQGELEKYLTMRNGGVQNLPQHGPTQDGSPLPDIQQEVTADPKQAIIRAMTSQYPQLRQVGNAEFAALGKGKEGPSAKDILTLAGYAPNSKVQAAMSGDLSQLKPETKTHVIRDLLVRDDGSKPEVAGDFGEKYGQIGTLAYGANGEPIIGQVENRSGRASFAPRGTSVNVDARNPAEKAFSVELGKGAVKRLEDSLGAAQKAQIGLETFANAATHVGNFQSGFATNPILAGKKFVSLLTGVENPSISSTEQVRAALGQAVLDNAKALGSGSGFSNTDREFLLQIVSGDIQLDEKTLKRAINIGLANNINALRNHNKLLTEISSQKDDPLLATMKVGIPAYTLPAEEFDFDPSTNMFSVKTSSGPAKKPITSAVPVPGKSGLTQEELKELETLRKEFAGRLR